MSARRGRGGEAGNALIMASLATILLALVVSVISYASVSTRIVPVYEVDQAQAAFTSQAGMEWVLGVLKTGWSLSMQAPFPGDGGTMTLERTGTKSRSVRSTGRRGLATRVSSADLTLVYVLGSRQAASAGEAAFEVFNFSGANAALTGWKLEYLNSSVATTAFYEEVRISVFSSTTTTAVNSIDYGIVWQHTVGGGGQRAASGTQVVFNQTATIANNRQALIQVRGFKNQQSGGGTTLDMNARDLRLTPRDGTVDMAGVGIGRAP